MNDNATNGKEASESVDEQRARWEGANYGMTVCANGVVNVENRNYGDDSGAHIYSVEVADGAATGCSCPHAVHRGAHCKHQRAVEHRPLVVSSATAAASTYAPVATDGGQPADETDVCDDCGLLLADAHEQPAGYTRKVLGDGGEYGGEICGACADIRGGRPRGERKTAGELGGERKGEA